MGTPFGLSLSEPQILKLTPELFDFQDLSKYKLHELPNGIVKFTLPQKNRPRSQQTKKYRSFIKIKIITFKYFSE
jgi:hypothetical protein